MASYKHFLILILVFAIAAFLLYKRSILINVGRSMTYLRSEQSYQYYNKRIVPISAYFDARPQQNHNNATVILLSVEKSLKNSIVGCEVDGVRSMNSLVEELGVMKWVHHKFKLSHTDCILYCWDMAVNQDSIVNVVLKINNELMTEAVRRPVIIPPHGPEINKVMVCATGFGTPKYLDQWLTYQQTIGVKFIHLNVVQSFMTNVNTSEVLNSLQDKGKVKITVWEEYLNSSQVYYYSQTLKYLDCIFQYQNRYQYMMIIDFDEYFIPAGLMQDVNVYVQTLFHTGYIGSIYIPTLLVHSCRSHLAANISGIKDGNITKLFNTSQFKVYLGKSIHQVHTVQMLNPHKAERVFPPYRTLQICNSANWCRSRYYMAHLQYRKHCETTVTH